MRFEDFSFGSIRIDGVTDEHDVVIDRGWVRKRKKKPSKKFRAEFGHTPLSLEEKIPWQCRRLVVGCPWRIDLVASFEHPRHDLQWRIVGGVAGELLFRPFFLWIPNSM